MLTVYRYAIPTLWAAWCLYWLIAAIGAKATRRRESIASRISHLAPLFVGLFLLASPRLADTWLAARLLSGGPGWFWAGCCCVALGLGFSVWARAWLGSNWSGLVTLKQDHELIRNGPYRFVRHPIYTGLLLAVLGSALALGELRGFVGVALVDMAFLRKLRIEERFMIRQFGATYLRYRAEVPALVPRPWRHA